MSNRLKQFVMQYKYFKMPLDEEFLTLYLNPRERTLFNRLNKMEQNHSILVAKALSQKDMEENHKVWVKVGLFHDIGKSMRPLNVIEKSLCVITHKLLGSKINRLGKMDSVASYLFHGERGAEILRRHQIFEDYPIFYDIIQTHHWNEQDILKKKHHKNILYNHALLKEADDQY